MISPDVQRTKTKALQGKFRSVSIEALHARLEEGQRWGAKS
jgi:hypothetical protein